MKKTRVLTLTLLAGAVTGCHDRAREAEVQRCIDADGRMAEELNCREADGNHPYYSRPRYRWVWGGNGGYTPGSIVTGYRDTPTTGLEHVSASSLAARGYNEGGARVGITESGGFTHAPSSRGGFGHSGEGHGGGRGGSGGGE